MIRDKQFVPWAEGQPLDAIHRGDGDQAVERCPVEAVKSEPGNGPAVTVRTFIGHKQFAPGTNSQPIRIVEPSARNNAIRPEYAAVEQVSLDPVGVGAKRDKYFISIRTEGDASRFSRKAINEGAVINGLAIGHQTRFGLICVPA